MDHRKSYLIAVSSCLAACASYEREPLEPDGLLASLQAELHAPRDEVSLKETVAWMLRHNPRIVAARGAWQQAHVVAEIPTPLANPSLSVGPSYLSGGGGSWGVDAGLGWVLPVFSTRGILDDRRASVARAAEVEAVATAREEYLGLRADLLAVTTAAKRVAFELEMVGRIRPAVERQRALGARATMSAIELSLLELDLAARTSQVDSVRATEILGRGRLARRCGVGVGQLGELPARVRPEIPAELPSLEEIRALVAEHPDLARLRARYEIAEHDVRLAVRRQYPALSIGGEVETGGGQDRFVLPLGIELPLFDRNRGPIAAARAKRAALRSQFHARLRERLTSLSVDYEALTVEHRRYQELDRSTSEVLVSSRAAISAAVRAGTMGAMDQFVTLRRLTDAEIARLTARKDLYAAWLRLEASCGAPLLRFPGQPDAPSRVAPLESPRDESPDKTPPHDRSSRDRSSRDRSSRDRSSRDSVPK